LLSIGILIRRQAKSEGKDLAGFGVLSANAGVFAFNRIVAAPYLTAYWVIFYNYFAHYLTNYLACRRWEARLASFIFRGAYDFLRTADGLGTQNNAAKITQNNSSLYSRLKDAGLSDAFSPHSFRATGITNYLENGGTLEVAQRIAGHADSRTTKLYDRRGQKVLLEDMERIRY
jgi:integrase